MKANEILQALNINNKPYAAKLASLVTLTTQLKKIPEFNAQIHGIKGNLELVRELPILDRAKFFHKEDFWRAEQSQNNCKYLFGHFSHWQPITITHSKGSYNVNIPTDNKFYYFYLDLIGVKVTQPVKENKKEVAKIMPFNNIAVLDAIKKAAKFVSDDDLRPVMQCICLDFTDNNLQIVATDAHRLYYSKSTEAGMWLGDIRAKTFKPFQLLIQPESVKRLIKSKEVKSEVYITVFNDNTALINGIEVNLLPDIKYPDYRCVIPVYEHKMTFDREQMISNVKSVMVYANKSTNQVNLNLNGNIKLSAHDVDFESESGLSMPYISKDFKDTEIGFNGKFLSEVLSIFKSNAVTMYSEGQPTRAAIFTDNIGNESVLLMPLMI